MIGRSCEEICYIMFWNFEVMKVFVIDGLIFSKLISGLIGGDVVKMD